LLTESKTYDDVYKAFHWHVPERFNMGVAVCDRQAAATPTAPALLVADENGGTTTYSFQDIRDLSNKLANLLVAQGFEPGDRLAILLSQAVETAAAHVAAWKSGLISIPMFTLFGEDALEYRFENSGAKGIITDKANLDKVLAVREKVGAPDKIFVVDDTAEGAGIIDLWKALDRASVDFSPLDTLANDPGLIIYTSGTTGNPKGALHAHRTLIGHMPGIEFPHEFFPKQNDLFWTPADWAWIGGLMNILMGAWFHGVPVLAHRMKKFEPEEAIAIMTRHKVRNTFIPPTALNFIRQAGLTDQVKSLNLRTIAVAGEPMGAELLDWGREAMGITFNEFYGQTECNLVAANCSQIMDIKPGSMGKAIPGHHVEIIRDDGSVADDNELGEIAVKAPDPVMFLEYWKNPEATKDKYLDDWLLTGDQGRRDEDGYLWFVGRDDDVITSAGYRIGPSEIEDCLRRHPAVALAAVIGVPDPVRTETIKAFILVKDGAEPGEALEQEIRDQVKTRLSPHEYPRLIEFVDELPLTVTGKVRRKTLKEREIAKNKTT